MINDLETRRRLSRLKTEAILLSQQFGGVRFDTQHGTWFYVEQFPLSPGWNKTHIELLIDIPHGTPGYPSVPPEWFWTDYDHFMFEREARAQRREYVYRLIARAWRKLEQRLRPSSAFSGRTHTAG